ncbi:MAG TPA: hypothetical protein VF942_16285, partial [Acidimicrobiales bacterium]
MSEPQLERSVLEAKDREELYAIADALGTKPGTRTKKADLIAQILRATGVDVDASAAAEKPRRSRARKGEPETATNGDSESQASAPTGDDEGASGDQDTDRAEVGAAATNGSAAGMRGEEGGTRMAGGQPTNTDDPAPSQPEVRQGPQSYSGVQQHDRSRFDGDGNRRNRRRRGRDRTDRTERDLQASSAEQQFSGEPIPVKGLLDLKDEGYGFLRTKGFLASSNDVYVSISQVRRFALRKGDEIEGACRPAASNEKYPALLRIDTVSGLTPDEARQRPKFEDLTPLFPDQKLRLEMPGDPANVTARIVDLISPIGKGQRGMIVSPPKAG